MPALQVRDFPATLYDELKEYAARNHRSIAQQTIIAVEEMLAAEASMSSNDSQKQSCVQTFGRAEVPLCKLEGQWPFKRTVSEERVRRRQQLFADFDLIDWKGAPSAPEDIVAFINESRNERTERIMASVNSPDFDE